MNRTNYSLCILLILFFFVGDVFAQTVKISAEVRPRYEFRHGFKTLFPEGQTAANFISQRTRLNGFFANDMFKAYVSLQDVRVWGDVNQLNTSDYNGFTVHEAWGQVRFCDVLSFKVGRQEIIYDDHRIFGSVGWAQQARSHDAAIFKFFFGDNHKLDFGIAYNAMQESLYEVAYTNNNYKTIQWLHYHGDFGKHGLSVLFLNNGLAYDADKGEDYDEKVAFSQTIGARYTLKRSKIKFDAAYYYQGGKNGKNNDLQAFYGSLNVYIQLAKVFNLGLGWEYLSGTTTKNQNQSDATDHSFSPFYGTNHKFNGWMDYFYVGNYNGQNGLMDIYLPLMFTVKKWNFGVIPHYFMAAATISDGTTDLSSGLGTELDFYVKFNLSKSVNFQGGYSQMFATETMQVVKYPDNSTGEFYKNTNNWAWIMITFKPMFWDSTKKKTNK